MIEWIIGFIIAAIIGYFIGKHFTEKAKFGDKESVINAQWEKRIANLEKDYEIKLEKSRSFLEKLKEENKTHLEKLGKEWQVKYIQDIEELKKLFKDSEKIIRAKSVSGSRRSLVGKFIEKFVPFLNKFPYEASDMHFLGQPVDYIVFQGLHEDKIDRVIFVEVKTGKSQLTKREKSLRDTIIKKRVGWKEINIDTTDENLPDREMAIEDTSISGLYDNIEQKVSSAKNKLPYFKKDSYDEEGESENEGDDDEENNSEEEEDDAWKCEHCRKNFILEEDEKEELDRMGILKIECPNCHKKTTCEYEEEE